MELQEARKILNENNHMVLSNLKATKTDFDVFINELQMDAKDKIAGNIDAEEYEYDISKAEEKMRVFYRRFKTIIEQMYDIQ